MKVREQLSLSEPPVHRDVDPHVAPPTPAEMEEAERLISDLSVLLDAGLIEVHEHVLGPVRYDVVPERHHPEERFTSCNSPTPH